MAVSMMRQELTATVDEFDKPLEPSAVRELVRSEQDEVIEFLSNRPIHTVFMAGLIRDNGLLSPRNRGSFYGCRNRFGELEGVALIGHATVVEANTENALIGFARVARNCHNAHLIRGERDAVHTFWSFYAGTGRVPRLISEELLYGLSDPLTTTDRLVDLRPATLNDLEKVLAVNSSMAFEEGGISPLQRDPSGFRSRMTRRIEQGRVWTWFEDQRLVFKADIVSETPQAAYLEGIYVHPEERRKGYAMRGLTQLSSMLLQKSNSVCLSVNQRNKSAIALYTKAGYQFYSHYETIYLR
jgi:ribosomal protein S18 acetylase RimI-like enzyme